MKKKKNNKQKQNKKRPGFSYYTVKSMHLNIKLVITHTPNHIRKSENI